MTFPAPWGLARRCTIALQRRLCPVTTLAWVTGTVHCAGSCTAAGAPGMTNCREVTEARYPNRSVELLIPPLLTGHKIMFVTVQLIADTLSPSNDHNLLCRTRLALRRIDPNHGKE